MVLNSPTVLGFLFFKALTATVSAGSILQPSEETIRLR